MKKEEGRCDGRNNSLQSGEEKQVTRRPPVEGEQLQVVAKTREPGNQDAAVCGAFAPLSLSPTRVSPSRNLRRATGEETVSDDTRRPRPQNEDLVAS